MKYAVLSKEIDREHLAVELLKWRLRMGYTQEQAAQIMGCSRYSILRLERGKPVGMAQLYSISAKLATALRMESGNNYEVHNNH